MSAAAKRTAYVVIAVLAGVLFVGGSVYDLPAAQAVYRLNDPAALAFSVAGVYLFFGSFEFLTGGLCRQLMHLAKSRTKRILSVVICCYLGLSTAVLGAAALTSDSVIGLLFPEVAFTFPHCVLVGLIGFYPLLFLGMLLNGRRGDPAAVRKLILLLGLMTLTFFAHLLLTCLWSRPRFRITLLGYDGLGFLPWYRPLQNAAFYKTGYGLEGDALRSFFSGHALDAVLNLVILPAFSLVLPKLQGKERLLQWTALLLILPIAFSRMVLGAHYLSDVSAGSLCGLGYVLLYELLAARIRPASETG